MNRREVIIGSGCILGGLGATSILVDSTYGVSIEQSPDINDISISTGDGNVDSVTIDIEKFNIKTRNFTAFSEDISIDFIVDVSGNSETVLSDSIDTSSSSENFTVDDLSKDSFDLQEHFPGEFDVNNEGDIETTTVELRIEISHPNIDDEEIEDDFEVEVEYVETSASFDDIDDPEAATEILLDSPRSEIWQDEDKCTEFFESGEIDEWVQEDEGTGPSTDYSYNNSRVPDGEDGVSLYLNTEGSVPIGESQRVNLG